MTIRTATALLLAIVAAPASATIPYSPIALPPGAVPGIGPGLISPAATFGKEYSHDLDESTLGGGGLADPQQVIAWDGVGGTTDGVDFSGSRPTYDPDDQVDAIANHNDALFTRLLEDRAHLVFSHDDMISVYPPGASFTAMTIPSAGPIPLASGAMIGGAGELSYELAGAYAPPSTQGVWATQADINGMPLPRDVDGVEVWGPEPGVAGDSDKYSLNVDAFSSSPTGAPATSIWNLSGTPYLSHSDVVSAVTALLGPLPPGVVLPYPDFIDGEAAINVDALMVRDVLGEEDSFDRDPAGGVGDQVIFSISQIVDPTDPDGYYATGSELFVLDGTLGPAGTTFLSHGGHLWDHSYALTELLIDPNPTNGAYGVIDINAIEAVGELVSVPEPATVAMSVLAFTTTLGLRRRVG